MIFLKAFVVGGLLCVVGQLLLDYTTITSARILVLYVVAGVFLGALGLYGRLVEFAGAGATVPLTGFGYSLYKGVYEALRERSPSLAATPSRLQRRCCENSARSPNSLAPTPNRCAVSTAWAKRR